MYTHVFISLYMPLCITPRDREREGEREREREIYIYIHIHIYVICRYYTPLNRAAIFTHAAQNMLFLRGPRLNLGASKK